MLAVYMTEAEADGKETPFHAATRCAEETTHGRLRAVQALLAVRGTPHGLTLTLPNDGLPLHLAAMYGDLEMVQYMLGVYPEALQHVEIYNGTPLHIAANDGYGEMVKLMLQVWPEGAAAVDNEERLPLHLAAAGCHPDVIATLLAAYPLGLRKQDTLGRSPLHRVVFEVRSEMVSMMLKVDSYPLQYTDCDGRTPLHTAAAVGDSDTVQRILDSGGTAQLEVVDNFGMTPLQVATTSVGGPWRAETIRLLQKAASTTSSSQAAPQPQ